MKVYQPTYRMWISKIKTWPNTLRQLMCTFMSTFIRWSAAKIPEQLKSHQRIGGKYKLFRYYFSIHDNTWQKIKYFTANNAKSDCRQAHWHNNIQAHIQKKIRSKKFVVSTLTWNRYLAQIKSGPRRKEVSIFLNPGSCESTRKTRDMI